MRRRKSKYRRRRPWFDKIDFNPEIKRGILAIFLFVLSGLSILSFFDLAGLAGSFWEAFLSLLFGDTRYIFPVVLIIVGYLIEKEGEYNYSITHFIGLFLFFLALNGIFHLRFPAHTLVDEAFQGNGGGLAGVILSWPLKQYLGYWASLTTLSAILLIALLFLFNTSLAKIIEAHRIFFAHLGWIGRSVLSLARSRKNIREDEQTATADAPIFERRQIDDVDLEDADFNDEETADDIEQNLEKNTELSVSAADAASNEKENASPKHTIKMKIWKLPHTGLLFSSKSKPTAGDIKANTVLIKETLAHFGISVTMSEVRVGPTVTQYTAKPDKGVRLNRISALHNDLALALAAHPIRIEAPIPGKSLIGIEVPNQRVAMVSLRELLEEGEFKPRSDALQFAIGKDVAGTPVFMDLARMPHMLVAGATGSGKTVGINTVVINLLFSHTPETLRFIMVDPKRVELPAYNGIPHLLTPVITDKNKTLAAIKWTITEMERRFDVLSKNGSRDIISFNKKAQEPLPFIVFIIDELADLMLSAGAEMEAGIVRLAQMSRAVGIHMVIATQRPSVDVITGLMKANIPARIAFSVASIVDSRTILDNAGAEKLLGRGDMLITTAELSKPRRLQGAYVSEEEIKRIVDYLKDQDAPSYENFAINEMTSGTVFSAEERDTMFEEARRVVIESGKASASYLQRRLRLGYARAARVLDELEAANVVGPASGSKPREVLMTPDDLDMLDEMGGIDEDDSRSDTITATNQEKNS